MPNIASSLIVVGARIARPARLVSLGVLVLLPAATRVSSVSGAVPPALSPVSVWARGLLQPRGVVADFQGAV